MASTDKVIGAASWASYLINGDASGLDDTERNCCDQWLATEVAGRNVVDCGEPYFSWSFGLYTGMPYAGGDVVEYTVLD